MPPFQWLPGDPFRTRILVIGDQCFNKQSQDFRHYQEGYFPTQFNPLKWSYSANFFSFRFNHCSIPVNKLSSQGCPKTLSLRQLSNKILGSKQFRKYFTLKANRFPEMFKIWCRFQECNKKLIKNLDFSNICILMAFRISIWITFSFKAHLFLNKNGT